MTCQLIYVLGWNEISSHLEDGVGKGLEKIGCVIGKYMARAQDLEKFRAETRTLRPRWVE